MAHICKQQTILETQHNIFETQVNICETQHKIIETQHKIMQNWCAIIQTIILSLVNRWHVMRLTQSCHCVAIVVVRDSRSEEVVRYMNVFLINAWTAQRSLRKRTNSVLDVEQLSTKRRFSYVIIFSVARCKDTLIKFVYVAFLTRLLYRLVQRYLAGRPRSCQGSLEHPLYSKITARYDTRLTWWAFLPSWKRWVWRFQMSCYRTTTWWYGCVL